jgi:ATP-binding protein involved in chromosome partitioning
MVDQKIQPVFKDGIPVMSMGFMVPPGEAVVWRGPMLHQAISQFLRDTAWGNLDYLIIDMPPGTGDIAITLSQLLPLTGAVVVCTPQDVALLDAVKAISMFRKVNIPILGMVENMSGFVCPDCNKRYDIFGRGGAQKKAGELNVPFLGEVPITIKIRENGDAGTTGENFDNPQAKPYLETLCYQLAKNISNKNTAAPPLPTLPVL